jgi:hypothetical protein
MRRLDASPGLGLAVSRHDLTGLAQPDAEDAGLLATRW